jgi:chlorophyll(ide) b reductase
VNVVITGSSKGLGLALAREFLVYGDRVVISSRTAGRVEQVVAKFGAEFGLEMVAGLPADVADAADMDALAAFAQEQFGSIDI